MSALPETLAALEKKKEQLHEQLADPSIYQAGPAESLKISAELAKVESDLSSAYARWEDLEARA